VSWSDRRAATRIARCHCGAFSFSNLVAICNRDKPYHFCPRCNYFRRVAEQSGQPKGSTGTILPDAALLIQGPFGEYSYKLTRTADDSVTLEEFGGRHMRLEIRQIPDKRCVFVSTREEKDGVDVAQLDLTKFDGTYQLWEACVGPASAPPENRCTYSLHFSSQKQAFCSSRFQKMDFDLSKIPFPDGACHSYALGARGKQFYTKYIDAYERIKEQCGGGQ
jgi:hypothetical protein